jgi:CheY-like chemotaxis protein
MADAIPITWLGPTHGCWAWVLEHFNDVSVSRAQDILQRIDQAAKEQAEQTRELSVSPIVVLACDARSDTRTLELAHRLEELQARDPRKPLPWCLLLGEDWAGHRRTHPLSEAWPTFYWYETLDRLLPWFESTHGLQGCTEKKESTGQRNVSLRVKRWLEAIGPSEERIALGTNRLALVVTESSANRELWLQTFADRQIACVATTPDQLNLWLDPDLIVVDLDAPPLAMSHALQVDTPNAIAPELELFQQLAAMHPKATRISINAFPRWSVWKSLMENGADLVLAKPSVFSAVLCRASLAPSA